MLATSRLLLRPWRVGEAGVRRRLWSERDPRVPPHRRIDDTGSPTLADLEAAIRAERPPAHASRRVLAKIGFTTTERTDVDPVRGTTLFTTLPL